VEQILLRLAEANIELLPALEITTHFVFTRDGFVALVERRQAGFGNIGAPGILCDKGMAQLVWRGNQAYFVAKGFEQPVSSDMVSLLRKFGNDLKKSLQS